MAIYGIDYGHTLSGADTGAVGNGFKEQEVTRAIGKLVTSKLKALGHTVIECACDSASNVSSSLAYRTNKANDANVDLFISIHVNAGGGSGTEVYTYGGHEVSEARAILNNIVSLGFRNRGIKDGSSLYVIRNTKMKSMLIETFFIDTNDTEKYKRVGAENIANAIVKGVCGKLPIENNTNNNQNKPIPKIIYDATRPTGENIYPIGKHSYIEETADGRTILHNDRGNYIAIGKGFIDLYWNDGNGKNGSKRISG